MVSFKIFFILASTYNLHLGTRLVSSNEPIGKKDFELFTEATLQPSPELSLIQRASLLHLNSTGNFLTSMDLPIHTFEGFLPVH